MANYKRLCQEALDNMIADRGLFTVQGYWDACNMEILCHVLGIDVVSLFEKYGMLGIAPVWLVWKREWNEDRGAEWKPRSEWNIYFEDEFGHYEFKKVSRFPELAVELKGSRYIKVLKEIALYEMEHREKGKENERS